MSVTWNSSKHSNHDLAAWCSSEVSIWGRCHSIQSVIYSYTFILLVILVNNLELPPWPVRSTLSPFEAPLSILATPFKKCWRLSANVERFSSIYPIPYLGPFWAHSVCLSAQLQSPSQPSENCDFNLPQINIFHSDDLCLAEDMTKDNFQAR